ncbi:UNVERIFIED_CONTAM: hypothetical protein K2H54_064681 [Gekko kuhli]
MAPKAAFISRKRLSKRSHQVLETRRDLKGSDLRLDHIPPQWAEVDWLGDEAIFFKKNCSWVTIFDLRTHFQVKRQLLRTGLVLLNVLPLDRCCTFNWAVKSDFVRSRKPWLVLG